MAWITEYGEDSSRHVWEGSEEEFKAETIPVLMANNSGLPRQAAEEYAGLMFRLQGTAGEAAARGATREDYLRQDALRKQYHLYSDSGPNFLDKAIKAATFGAAAYAGGGAAGLYGAPATAAAPVAAGTAGAGAAPYIGAGGSAAAGATPALLGETALGAGAGVGALGAATAATAAPVFGSPEWEAAQGIFPADLPPQAPDWMAGIGGSAGGAAGQAAAGSALSRIIDGTATTADWTQVLGTAGATGLGMFAANQQANTLSDLANQNRAERAPYLQASQGWLADPSSYMEGPGSAAMKSTLAQLSARGNPLGSGTSLALANEAGLRDWRDAVTGFGNMGLSGADTRANLGMASAGAQGNIWGNLAGGISDVVNPKQSLADLLKQYRNVI